MELLLYSLISVLIISLISLIGILFLSIRAKKLRKIVIYLISFSAGILFGDVFLHILPELTEEGFSIFHSMFIIFGILLFFSLEKFIFWTHCHLPITREHIHSFSLMNLLGDGLHNFIDGMIIAGSYLISIQVGITTSIAILFHEIPQEIGDFGILIHGGFSKIRAITLNLLVSLTSILGVIAAFILREMLSSIEVYLISVAVGGFLYIAGSDLIPELHKESEISIAIVQIISFIFGVLIMFLLLNFFG